MTKLQYKTNSYILNLKVSLFIPTNTFGIFQHSVYRVDTWHFLHFNIKKNIFKTE